MSEKVRHPEKVNKPVNPIKKKTRVDKVKNCRLTSFFSNKTSR